MRRRYLLLIVALALAASVLAWLELVPIVKGAGLPSFDYLLEALPNGTLLVTVTLRARTPGEAAILLPLFTRVEGPEVMHGRLLASSRSPSWSPFYALVRFSYEPDGSLFEMRLRYTMQYGVLIVEPNGLFLSPIIDHSVGVGSALVRLRIPVDTIVSVNPSPDDIEYDGGALALRYRWRYPPGRLVMFFTTPGLGSWVNISSPPFLISVPLRYERAALELAEIYSRAYPLLSNLTGIRLDFVLVRFFVPRSYVETGIVGFVPFRPPERPYEIYMNVLYLRSFKGVFECGAVHELVHHFLLRMKISPRLLWIHEGIAEYLGLAVTEAIDQGGRYREGVNFRRSLLSNLVSRLGDRLGFVQGWQPGVPPRGLLYYYAASYEVFVRLTSRYGGLEFFRRLFAKLREAEGVVNSTSVFVRLVNEAVGADVTPLFRRWGFLVVDRRSIEASVRRCARLSSGLNPLRPLVSRRLELVSRMVERGEYEAALVVLSTAYVFALLGKLLGMLMINAALASALAAARRAGRRLSLKSSAPATLWARVEDAYRARRGLPR